MTTVEHQPILRIERRFSVSPEVVFDTLTKPELMKVWWGDGVEVVAHTPGSMLSWPGRWEQAVQIAM